MLRIFFIFQRNVSKFYFIIQFLLIALTAGCASTPELITPQPVPPPPVERVKPAAAPLIPPPKAPVKPVLIATPPAAISDKDVLGLILKLLPRRLKDKNGWATDLKTAFLGLKIEPIPENFCATIAIIEQESSFQADPVVPGLPAIIRKEIEQRRTKYSIPQTLIDWMLVKESRDGRTFNQRINALKTEKELSDMIEEIIAMVPAGRDLFPNYNPVHTGGAMQVSVEFAESHARARPYPYTVNGNLRNEVFSRRGGIYFGSAILLDYPAPYTDMLYRFADFNAGRYSSRNAAFQQALSQVSKTALIADGDLLRYKNGTVSGESSATLSTLTAISAMLKMSEAEIRHDLNLEKLSGFSSSTLYRRLYALADKGGLQPRVALPQIDLQSPKIKRKLTTAWFATRVNNRYKNCLKQQGSVSADNRQ